MTPDEIRDFLGKEYPQLVSKPRRNPDGWSFFFELPSKGRRILTATRSGRESDTKFILPIANRLGLENLKRDFDGNIEDLRLIVDEEIRLYLDHFAGKIT